MSHFRPVPGQSAHAHWDGSEVAHILPIWKHPSSLFLFILTPHLLSALDSALPSPPSPHHRLAWPATCPVVLLHDPPRDKHHCLEVPVVHLLQEVVGRVGRVATIVPATPQQLRACPWAGERLVWPHPISQPW